MKKSFVVLLLTLALFLPATTSQAQDMGQQKAFTADELDKFLADYPDYMKWAMAKGMAMQSQQQEPTMEEVMAMRQEINDFLAKRGWSSPERFMYILGQVSLGMLPMQGGGGSNDMLSALKAQRSMIENNPNIPESEKKSALADIDETLKELAETPQMVQQQVKPEELALINERRDEIMKVLGAVAPQ